MSLNFKKIGKVFGPTKYSYTKDDVILYALGIGADIDKEFEYLHEKNLKVIPTFAVVPPSVEAMDLHNEIGINMNTLLHLQQQIEIYEEIPTSGTVYTRTVYEKVYDKGDTGAIIHVTAKTCDSKGNLLFINKSTHLDKSAGGFGGDRGPKVEKFKIPEDKPAVFRFVNKTNRNQAALYRLSGDKNPIHIEPEFAQKSGFDMPILHGLCTAGFACRAIINEFCDGKNLGVKFFSTNFTGVIFPGETLITEAMNFEHNTYMFQVKTSCGRVVLSNGKVVLG